MSNFNIGQKPNFQRTQNMPILGGSRIQKTTQPPSPPPSTPNRNLSQVLGPSSSQSSPPPLPPLPEPKHVEQKIETTDPHSMQQLSSEIPVRPEQLGPPPSQPSPSTPPVPPGSSPQVPPLAPPPGPPKFSDLLSDDVQKAHAEVAKTMLQVDQHLDVSLFLANNLLPSLQSLRQADSGFGRQAKIDNALNNSEQAARDLMRSIGFNSDVSFVLKGKSQAELTTLVTRALQQMMGYSDQQMAQLSDKKQAWIARTVAGIQAGLLKQPPGPIKGQVAQSLERLEQASRQSFQRLGNLHPLSIHAMGLKPSEMAAQLETLMGKNPPEIMSAIQRGIDGAFGNIAINPDTDQVTAVRHNNTDYRVIKELGRGQCGTVMLIEGPGPEHKKYALKPLDADARAVNELQIQIRAAGVNTLRVDGVIKQGNQIFAMIELASGGEMMDNLQFIKTALKDQQLSPEDGQKLNVRLAIGAARALADFHSKGLIHRDIKEQNFFLGDGAHVKLGDMGEALPHNQGYTETIGTPDYMAPEVTIKDKLAGQPADNWALGIMLHKILLGSHPFDANVPDRFEPGVATQTAENGVRFSKGESLQRIDGSTFQVDFSTYPNPLNTLFQGLFHPDPSQRMTASQAVQLLQTMDDPQFNFSERMEASRNYGKNEEKIQKVVAQVLEQKMAQHYPQIPHIQLIERELGRYERSVKQYSDPVERQKLITPQMPVERVDQLLHEYQQKLELNRKYMHDYQEAKEALMPQIMQLPEVVELTSKRAELIQKLKVG